MEYIKNNEGNTEGDKKSRKKDNEKVKNPLFVSFSNKKRTLIVLIFVRNSFLSYIQVILFSL